MLPCRVSFGSTAAGPVKMDRLHGDELRASRVQGAVLLRTVICSLLIGLQPPLAGYPPGSLCPLRSHSADMPRSKVDPGEIGRLSPVSESADAEFSILLQGSSFTSQPYGAISILQVIANHPVACRFPCIRFVEIVPPSIVINLRLTRPVLRW